jgi:hypothetical protein
MSMPISAIALTAFWFSFSDASVPAEQTVIVGLKDCKKP